jgi:hypothetical protein
MVIDILKAVIEPLLINKLRDGKPVAHIGQTSTQVGLVGAVASGAYAVQAGSLHEAAIAAAVAVINLYFVYKKP